MSIEDTKAQAELNTALSGCVVALLMLITMPVASWWHAFVMMNLYNWFLLPVDGFPTLSIGNFIGVSLITGMLTYNLVKIDSSKEQAKNAWNVFVVYMAKMSLIPAFVLFTGWLYQQWFM